MNKRFIQVQDCYVDDIGNPYDRQKQIFNNMDIVMDSPIITEILFWPYVLHRLLQKLRSMKHIAFFQWELNVAPINYSYKDYIFYYVFQLLKPFKSFAFYKKFLLSVKKTSYSKKVFKKNKIISKYYASKDEHILVINHYFQSFGHFMLQVLPSIYLASEQFSSKSIFLIPRPNQNSFFMYFNPYKQYLFPTLDAFNIPENRRLHLHKGELAIFNTLNVCTNYSNDAELINHKKSYHHLSDYYYDSVLQNKYKDYEYVYVSRKKRGTRQIVNEDELYAALKPLGFKYIDMADYSFIESINLFRNVKGYISYEGSADYNLFFSQHMVQAIYIRPLSSFSSKAKKFFAQNYNINIFYILDNSEDMVVRHNGPYGLAFGSYATVNIPRAVQYVKQFILGKG